ncbi:hypothetical protein CBF23_002990 [Marinomonas agarivorans]|nr:hypothetical protein CBF23_002990 [Marinomonas agarivorans]
MKATKLASIFAVTAVAAAVSTTTLAAEAVFSGDAGLKVTQTDPESGNKSSENKSEGEVNIIMDTGVVYLDMDMETVLTDIDTNNGDKSKKSSFVLDEIYVTQGAVQFGDFDGSLTDAAVEYGGVDEGDDYSTDLGFDLGVRYTIMDGLVVAVEAVEGTSKSGIAFAYEGEFGPVTARLSYGHKMDGEDDDTALAFGASFDAGVVTLHAYSQSGELDGTTDLGSTGFGVDLDITEDFSISVAALDNTEKDTEDNTEVTAYYTAGDLTYWATMVDYNEDQSDTDFTTVGVQASF